MTTFHCDKLCGETCCASLVWALEAVASHPNQAVLTLRFRFDSALVRHNGVKARNEACAAIIDPSKLAELMASALRARGFDVPGPYEQSYWEQLVIDTLGKSTPLRVELLRVELPENGCVLVLDMPTARAKLLAIMQTSPDESSRETCEQILRGDEFEIPPEIPLRSDSLEYVPRRQTSDPDEVA